MTIRLESIVNAPIDKVKSHFAKDLFTYLLPPGAKLLRFDGSQTGDIVHLKLPGAGEWMSEIVSHGEGEGEWFFVDKGKILPMGLQSWRHEHRLQDRGDDTVIVDHMQFSTGKKWLDSLIYPFLYLSFYPRKFQYNRYFSQV